MLQPPATGRDRHAVSRTRGRRDARIPPREVAGYAQAYAAGQLPLVPQHPPTLVVRPTARAQLHRLIVLTFTGVLAAALLGRLLERLAWPGGLRAVVLGAVALALGVGTLRLLAGVGNRSLAELERGYTTLELTFGGFWFGEGHEFQGEDLRAPWDYRGTWLLHHRDGRVLRAPDPTVDPPGMYPSPHRPGRRELWTGAVWLDHYSD